MDVKKVDVARAYMGSLMTSLEMAGVSVTLIKLTSSQWTKYLGICTRDEDMISALFIPTDAPTTTPAWPNPLLSVGGSYKRVDKPLLVVASSSMTSTTALAKSDIHISTTLGKAGVTIRGGGNTVGVLGRALKSCTEEVCKSLLDNEALLNELDRGSGDGDCGSTLKSGAQGGSHVIQNRSHDLTHNSGVRSIVIISLGHTG